LREYSNIISLTQNERGVYSIDPSIGCMSGMQISKQGCYNDCYSAKSAKLYGYDFSKTVLRDFKDKKHLNEICREIKRINMPFIRMGSSGDPSENWEHTLKICNLISQRIKEFQYGLFEQSKEKQIVIITKHWQNLTDNQLIELKKMNVCINTSISAVDSKEMLENRLNQYQRLKPFCKSILRIVSFDFNEENEKGANLAEIQRKLFKNDFVIDTVFRASKSNPLVKEGVINVKKSKFLGKNALISKYNKKTYFGKCGTCLEMCGVTLKS